ncbi:Type I transmembrane sorting receptor [Xylographa bjoerkii]|nr:Type I transmembrane sorting receptor [Xylographa bjoerkii]
MHFTIDQLSLVAAVLATVASATPLSKRDHFSISQSSTTLKSGRKNGPAAKSHAYHRYHKTVSPSLQDAASRMSANAPTMKKTSHGSQKALKASKSSSSKDAESSGVVDADPTSGDDEYISQITIGGQKVSLQFDTGSSDLWVFSAELSTSEIGNHSVYDPTQSSTSSQLQGASWSITYGDSSSAGGDVYTDTVNVGGAIATGQAIETASNISSQFVSDYSSDGLMGLAFDSINTAWYGGDVLIICAVSPNPQKTFFTNVKPSLAAPLFTADLYHDQPGTFDFGTIDSTKYTGGITYVPVNNSQGFWGVTSSSYGIGSSSNMVEKKIDAIVDTGTTLLLVPQEVLDAYYKKVKGSKNSDADGGYIFPCDATLPDFYIGMGNYTAMVPASAINTGPADGDHCYGGIQFSDPSNGPAGIYGDVFLKSSFVVFQYPDGEQPTVGFAAKAGANSTGTPTSSSSPSSAPTSSPSGGSDGGDDGGDDDDDGDDGEDGN